MQSATAQAGGGCPLSDLLTPRPEPKPSAVDHGLIYGAAFLALTNRRDPDWETVRLMLAELRPRITPGYRACEQLLPTLDPLIGDPPPDIQAAFGCAALGHALGRVFMERFARAADSAGLTRLEKMV